MSFAGQFSDIQDFVKNKMQNFCLKPKKYNKKITDIDQLWHFTLNQKISKIS